MKIAKKIIGNLIIFIIIAFSYTLVFTLDWLYKTFGNLTLEEILFQIKVPMTGSNTDFYYDFAEKVLPHIIMCTIISFTIIFISFRKRKYKIKKEKRKGSHADISNSLVVYKKFKINTRYVGKAILTFIILISSLVYTNNKTNLVKYVSDQLSNSNLIEEEYVDPKMVEIRFPENKRNLIYIYLESMEATFFSKENGGAYDKSIIPELEKLAIENVSFSASEEMSGLYSLPGTTWTVGAMVAQTTGLPLKIPIDVNQYGDYNSFLPGAYSLGQILREQNYKQILMIGSIAEFGGRNKFFKQHGGYEIFDFKKAVELGKKREEDFVWWGFPDTDLFEYAKEELVKLAKEEQTFNFTMLTVDTHFADGYRCEDCESTYKDIEPYFDVLRCSSKKVYEFVEWIKTQDFYENTTIVICGDHISMQPETFSQIENDGYIRTVYNTILNSTIDAGNTKNKSCTTLDMLPTTLASIGVKIEGDKLGLGTNLFSNKETILEKYGLNYLTAEISKNSMFYNTHFVYQK